MRAHQQCERCGAKPRGHLHWHHRRSRRVIDEHTHSVQNGVLLCQSCHTWAHGPERFTARREGFSVSQWEGNPGSIPIKTRHGWVTLTDLGTYQAFDRTEPAP